MPIRAIRLLALAFALSCVGFATPAATDDTPRADAEAADAPAAPDPAAEMTAEASVQATPTAVVDRLHAALYAVMKNAEALGYAGRYAQLDPVVAEIFDLDFMAQKSVGRYWKTASPDEQKRLLDAFRRYTTANYAGRFTGWTGQEFTTHGEEPSARGTMLVRTTLHDPTDEDVKLDYRLRETPAGWRVVDIYFNGTVSELALRRSEYSSLIKREGFDALLVALDERVDELDNPASDEAS